MPVLSDPLGWFTLQLPDDWESQTEDCVTTLRGPLGLGVVFLSGARHTGGRQRSFGGADFLARFLRSIGVEAEDDSIQSSEGVGCRVYSYAREEGGRFWRHWSITDDETALLVSYTCAAEDEGQEDLEVEEIVGSIRLFHSAPVH
ncbi:MAG: hypothetical protein ACHQNV_07040 [Vicinamibacteria bacterium]